jgi:hypothetical protein
MSDDVTSVVDACERAGIRRFAFQSGMRMTDGSELSACGSRIRASEAEYLALASREGPHLHDGRLWSASRRQRSGFFHTMPPSAPVVAISTVSARLSVAAARIPAAAANSAP